jgi:hypothetical protein
VPLGGYNLCVQPCIHPNYKCGCRSWMFSLNPDVTWQEVGIETKLRLKTLPVEVVRNTCS